MNRTHYTPLLITMALFIGCSKKITEQGKASYYADKFVGRKTANGETFSQRKMTAAHKYLPFGTKVKITNISNGKTIRVRINDRGPFVAGRVIDLSKKAAKKLGMIQAGVSEVRLKYKKAAR